MKSAAVLACLLLAAPCLIPPARATDVDAPAPAGVSGAVPSGVKRTTLPNGLRVVVVPDRLAPVVTSEINYLAGSNDAPDGFPGTAHALEHMMFRGSEGLDRDQLSQLGALLGGDYNADTTETVTQYFYTVPAADLGVALRTEALRMRGAKMDQADWDQERGAIEQEVSRDLSSPIYNTLSQMQAILFAGTPYEHDALGTRPSFDKTDAALLRQFYDRWYAPNNAILVIAGDVDPDAAIALATQAFGDIARRDLPEHKVFDLRPVQAKTLELPTNFPVGLVTIGYRMPGLQDKDFAAADILADVLGSERGPLYALVPEGKALFAQFSNEPKAYTGFALAMGGFPKGGDPAPLLADMRAAIGGIARDGAPPDLIEAARRQELAQLAFHSDSITGLANSWSQALAFEGAETPDDIGRAYQAVTAEDVARMAKLLLDPEHSVVAILTPAQSGKPVPGAGFGGAESFGGAPDKPVTLPDWASEALANLSLPDPGVAPDVSTLPNGLRLIVQPEHVSRTVSVYGLVRQTPALQEPAGKDGVSGLVTRLFTYGSEHLDRLAFQTALDDIAAQAQPGPRFTLKVLTPQFEPGMKLLADVQLRPAFPADAFPIVRKQLSQGLAGMLQSPDYLSKRAIKTALLPKGDPDLRQPTPATVDSLSPEDVRAYYKAAYRPDATTIVVVGDVSPEEARRVVSETFGDWSAPAGLPPELPEVGPNKTAQLHVPDSTSVQDSVELAETVQVGIADPERYMLMLGNTILGGGFSSRLYRDLRVQTGYVYSVSSDFDFSRTRAEYGVSFGADPDKVAKARGLAVRDIKAMQDAPVSEAELTLAKAQMLRRLPMQKASADSIGGLYLRLADLGLPIDAPQTAAKLYFDADAAAIQAAFKKHLRPDDLAEVVKGPPVAQ